MISQDDSQPRPLDPHADVRRSFALFDDRIELRTSTDGDGLTLEGLAAVFNSPTRISDHLGEFDEQIEKGAFAKSLRERKPVLQFDHGAHPLIGSIPLGAITTLREDDAGLFVRARLADNWLVQPVRDAIAAQAISGMSFRFNVLRDEWTESDDGTPLRTLQEIRLLELGPVVFPAYQDTLVAVRSSAARRIVDEIRAADEETRRDLASLLVFPPSDVSADPDAADDGTSGEATGTPPIEAPAAVRAREIRDRVMENLQASLQRQEKRNGQ